MFVKLALHAVAIVTQDTAILETVKRINNVDSSSRYDPDITRLTTLQYLAKVRGIAASALRSAGRGKETLISAPHLLIRSSDTSLMLVFPDSPFHLAE